MIVARSYNEKEHYDLLCSWWQGHNWTPLPIQALPSNGIVTYYGNKPVSAGFLYKTDSSIAWLEWLVCDPKAAKEYRSDCINNTIESLCMLADELGYKLIMTSVNNIGLKKRLDNHGFQVTDKKMTNYLKVM